VVLDRGVTTMYAIPAPADQPSVTSPNGCRYRQAAASDKSKTSETSILDPRGCYGLDSGGSEIVYRPDFCPVKPS